MKKIRTGRKSIYVPDSQESAMYRLLSMRGDSEVSRTLDTAIDRYLAVIGHSLPDLSSAEWCMVLDSQLGVWLSDEPGVLLVGETTLETMDEDELDKKWGVDAGRMREIMSNLTYAEQQAVCEFIEVFRKVIRDDDTGASYDGMISRVLTMFRPYASDPMERLPHRLSPDRLET